MKSKNIISLIFFCLLMTSLVAQKKQYIAVVPKVSSLLIPTIGVEYARIIYQKKEWIRLDATVSYDFIEKIPLTNFWKTFYPSLQDNLPNSGTIPVKEINLGIESTIHHTNIGVTLAFDPNKKEKRFFKVMVGFSAYQHTHIISLGINSTIQLIERYTLNSADFGEGQVVVTGLNWGVPSAAFGIDWNLQGDNNSKWLLGIEIGGNFPFNFKRSSRKIKKESKFFEYLSTHTNKKNEILETAIDHLLKRKGNFFKGKGLYTYLSCKLGFRF